jgi:hypothetical protein
MPIWHNHLQLILQWKYENLKILNFFSIVMLTCPKLQVEQMAPHGVFKLA